MVQASGMTADGDAAAALVMAAAPRPGACGSELESLLGAPRCLALRAALIARAARWACAVAPRAAFVGFAPADARDELAALTPAGAQLIEQRGADPGARLAAASEHVFDATGGAPLMIVGAESPALTLGHAAAALDDLRAGCDVSVGPDADGGWYLLALARAHASLLELVSQGWDQPGATAQLLGAVSRDELRVGLLRGERALRSPSDLRALLADPLAPADIVAALSGD